MTFAYAPDVPLADRRAAPRAWRWSVVLVGVVCLHLALGIWFARQRDAFAPPAATPPVEVALLQPERVAREPSTGHAGSSPAPRPAPARRGAPHRREDSVLQALAPAKQAPAAPATAASAPSAQTQASGASAGSGAAPGGPATDGHGSAGESGAKFSVPPSGDLSYDTFYNGVQNQSGTIHWASDGKSYEMEVSIPLPFVGTFTYASRGRIDAFGLAPERYVEHRGRRGENVTTFERDAKRIAFTRTSATLALPDGAQDRFSMVMQLASLVRGDPEVYRPGVTRNFYVADSDSGEIWPIETIGDETVRTSSGFVNARHFMRLPRRAGDSRRIDVWLAPALGWLPVRIAQTEPNGTVVELVWHGRPGPSGSENADPRVTPPDTSGVAPEQAPVREKP
ncbi:DUF3108 domain-containing protein [Trinickia caryophylli]|uniref:DUF3108 domain-containing protein n=1 Tax=Trinickia caryophylli TaxID=28094 RepID=A0A1X7EN44_TRICW|nr:DUF3108 domain-containing protein [Trinickia caryophylli]PMS10273.1 DUF3108 domain-containing protein [Trinickia caryophylli]WQE10462.1 DUF3108 domain-containing protein [Trinickia caryophylli]GLU32810.1 hypothetical protein Busp01_26520 [Trinickia caryophylli]SMF36926.1 Protein of unknown function [Trinickia caryophylli]